MDENHAIPISSARSMFISSVHLRIDSPHPNGKPLAGVADIMMGNGFRVVGVKVTRRRGASKLRLGRTLRQYFKLFVREHFTPPPSRVI